MAEPPAASRQQYATRKAIAAVAAAGAADLWAQVQASAIAASWTGLLGPLLALVGLAQRRAAERADGYLQALHESYGTPGPRRPARVIPEALAGVASDGRPLDTLLLQPALRALATVGSGAPVEEALRAGAVELDLIVRTQVSDAGRVADQVALVADETMTGYVRMLNPPSCARCIILAGRRYRWNAGFRRHPRCDCIHIPTSEDVADDLRTDPKAYVKSLTAVERDKLLTKAGAEAWRDGADLAQLVNARSGIYTAGDRKYTRVGTSKRGLAGTRLGVARGRRVTRLMPEQIYIEAAGDRNEARRLLWLHGYLL